MSGADSRPGRPASGSGQGTSGDPSMEEVLASIRRILSEEGREPAPIAPAPAPAPRPKPDGVLLLDPSMMVPEDRAETPAAGPPPSPTDRTPDTSPGSVAPEAAAAATTAMGSLEPTPTPDRSLKIRPGGATIEDIVRDELRLLLKDWLDAHLEETVERLVRAEVERVVGRRIP